MGDNETHADNLTQKPPIIKSNPIDEMEFGTISIRYSNRGILNLFLSKSHKPKNAKCIEFAFDSNKKIYNKYNVHKLTNFTIELSSTSICPITITKTNTGKTFLKSSSIIKKEVTNALPDLKMFNSHPSLPNAIPSDYNCIYNMHDFGFIGHVRFVLGLLCISDESDLTKFIFAYNKNILDTNEVTYLLNGILCGKFL